jgi:hypothetical protein
MPGLLLDLLRPARCVGGCAAQKRGRRRHAVQFGLGLGHQLDIVGDHILTRNGLEAKGDNPVRPGRFLAGGIGIDRRNIDAHIFELAGIDLMQRLGAAHVDLVLNVAHGLDHAIAPVLTAHIG